MLYRTLPFAESETDVFKGSFVRNFRFIAAADVVLCPKDPNCSEDVTDWLLGA